MKILYFDCPTGISGDMCLAALIDAGLDINTLKRELKKLPVKDYTIITSRERRHAIDCTRFKVRIKETHHHRTFKDIKSLIEESRLSTPVKNLSIKIFHNLAVAEGKIHGVSHMKVHFHEVGAVDSIVDIVGAAIAIDTLKITKVYASAIPLGSGSVNTMHGVMPIPAPATLELMKGIPVAPSPIPKELTTPTGAAILKTLCSDFGHMPGMSVESVGYGAGGKDFREMPNALRAVIGNITEQPHDETVFVVETNIDDSNPQLIPHLMEKLLDAGALDVYAAAALMKKSRPGLIVSALTTESRKEAVINAFFNESTTIGIRLYPVERRCLERKIINVKTRYGTVKVKVSCLNGKPVNAHPEFEDAKKIALKHRVPLKHVMDEAKYAAFAGRQKHR